MNQDFISKTKASPSEAGELVKVDNPASPFSYQAPPPKKKARICYSTRDRVFSYLTLIPSFLLIMALPVSRSPLGLLLSLFLMYVAAFSYLLVHKFRPSPRAWISALLFLLPAASFLTGQNGFLQFCSCLFSLLGLLFVISDGVGRIGKGVYDKELSNNLLDACFVTPAGGFSRFFGALLPAPSTPDGKKRMGVFLWILVGIAIAVIPTTIIILILSYDAQFTALLDTIFSFDATGVFRFIRDLAFALPLGAILFGAQFAAKAKPAPRKILKSYTTPDFTRPLLCAAVTPVLLVYVIFFISQRGYYLSALTRTLPEGLTFAEYARDGFFELCTVAVINALILLAFGLLFAKKKEGKNLLCRIYVSVISLFTLILIATAISKMVLYIDAYGLTQKRIWSTWLMIVLAFVFIAVLVAQIARKLPLVPVLAIGFFCLFVPVTLCDIDAAVANYNVEAYLEGELPSVDLESLDDLGSSAVPALVKLYNEWEAREDAPQLGHCKYILHMRNAELAEKSTVFSFNLPDLLAEKALEECNLPPMIA